MRQKLLKPWVVMPVVAVLAFGGWFAFVRPDGGSGAAEAPTDQLVSATSGTMAETVSADGTIEPFDSQDLSFASAGTVTAVNVKAGDKVKAGQVLATIDAAALEAAVADAESTVAQAQAELADDQDADASDAQITADASSLASANDQLTSAQDDLTGAQLVAGIDGTVASVDLTVGEQLSSGGSGGTSPTGSDSGSGRSDSDLGSGQNVPNNGASDDSSSSTAQIEIITSGTFKVDLGVDSSDIGKLKVGQLASVTVSTSSGSNNQFGGAFPGGVFDRSGAIPGANSQSNQQQNQQATTTSSGDAASGYVTSVSAVADASSGVASYPVTVAFGDTTGQFNVGATVTAAITYNEVKDAVQVPALAITTNQDGTSKVTVDTNGHRETRTVTTGLRSGSMAQITSGLKAGEQVVVSLPGATQRFGGFDRPGG